MKSVTGGYVTGAPSKEGGSPRVTQPGAVTKAPRITEAAFLRQLRDIARIYGWATYHPFLSKWSERGWPDLTLCRPPRLVLAELKTETGKTSEEQDRWLGMLGAVPGIETYLWRPSDFDEIVKLLQ